MGDGGVNPFEARVDGVPVDELLRFELGGPMAVRYRMRYIIYLGEPKPMRLNDSFRP